MKPNLVLPKKLKTATFNYLAFLASSLFLLSIAIFSLVWFQKQKNASDLISHTYEVKLKIEMCFGLLLEAESNQRGFLINNDSTYLPSLGKSELLLNLNLKQLGSLISDNADQVNNFTILNNLILYRVNRLHEVLASSGVFRNKTVMYTSRGKILMDSIRTQVRLMESAEDTLLKRRTALKQTQDSRVSTFIILFSIFAFAILMWSMIKIKNENTLRLKAQLNAGTLEKLVTERTAEINNINDILKIQNEQLERKNLDLTSFTYIASHDLKEPLRKIETFVNRITQSDLTQLDEKSQGYFDKIAQQSKRMQHLIESVLQYAQTDDESLGFTDVSLSDIANLALETLSELIKEKNASIEIGELPVVYCVADQMEQVFTNLIENSLKYSKPGEPPFLQISATKVHAGMTTGSKVSNSWKIDFADHGLGFDETYKEKIFEIFQRLHIDDTYTGTGIGLAICKKIIGNHLGMIEAKSIPGEGSVFSIILPIK